MDIETLDVDGIKFISCVFLSFGDYDGSTDVERGNVAYLEGEHDTHVISMPNIRLLGDKYVLSEMEWQHYTVNGWKDKPGYRDALKESPVLIAYGSFGSRQAWIREDVDEENEYLTSLTNYPILDDMACSEARIELENQAWDTWVKHDLISDVVAKLELLHNDENEIDFADWFEQQDLSDNDWHTIMHDAMEATNSYFEMEGGGNVYIPHFDDIVKHVANVVYSVYSGGICP